ncbi:LOG family protein [Magnetovibrio blakemorei]|uniref:AMP nucleosidase n=1 Tax=Magnetovibrio blakemorei TaxID=28181 RepID=A0A1E5Q7R1_9PROT|nr:LOG family protein [Magnetovibrio blakemorei]OEJ67088.1 lysine decarboxylase [Magnetovibrio blakemorei]
MIRKRADRGVDEAVPKPVKAYTDLNFLNSRAGRPMRILAEFLEPEDRFERHNVSDTIVFFGSARIRSREVAEEALDSAKKHGGDVERAEQTLQMSRYYEEARELSRRLTEWSKGLTGRSKRFVMCTGGGPGIMEAANRGAADAKGHNIGLNISLPFEQHENPYISHELSFDFHYFFMRKFWFSYLAKAMIVFPGGYGTLDEFFELMTLVSTRKMGKAMPVILYGSDYWKEILNLDAMVKFGTISPSDLELFHCSDSVDDAYDYLTKMLSEHHLDKPGGGM